MTPQRRAARYVLTIAVLANIYAIREVLNRDKSFNPQPTFAPVNFDSRRWATQNLYQATTPMDVTLRIVSQDEFVHETAEMNARLQAGYAVGGFTMFPTANSRCVITLPAGMLIHAEPWRAFAEWGDKLAHELLHCILGDWHPPLLCVPDKHP